jgi:hypothetical protein
MSIAKCPALTQRTPLVRFLWPVAGVGRQLNANRLGAVAEGDPGCQGNPDGPAHRILLGRRSRPRGRGVGRRSARACVALADSEAIFRAQEPNKRMRDQAARVSRALCRSRVVAEMHQRAPSCSPATRRGGVAAYAESVSPQAGRRCARLCRAEFRQHSVSHAARLRPARTVHSQLEMSRGARWPPGRPGLRGFELRR